MLFPKGNRFIFRVILTDKEVLYELTVLTVTHTVNFSLTSLYTIQQQC